ncbi:glycosyltransferase [Maribellus comscasis]|uniref:Glycosyltransferase n=1 Tax=Maribellus comscasis TaxID=2681766 RepID=A0A6I6JNB4_9BACT|nr:glycosyltransferase family 1 protein [Maribellus comscasis]QGY44446.1 glycosyltransferase [Maribellus comscasis]
MKILFDHQAFSYQDYGGVSRYFVELYKIFSVENDVDFSVTVSNSEFLGQLNQKAIHFFQGRNFVGKRYAMNRLNIPFSKRKIRKGNFDVFHPTYFDPYFTKANKKPGVITVHDLTVDLFPEYFKSYDFAKRENKLKCFESVDAIISVSENTKKDIVELYNISPEKIHVVYHGVNQTLTETMSDPEKQIDLESESYILYVGSRRGYKNFLIFVKAVSLLLKKQNIHLVCIGGGAFNKEEIIEFTKLGVETNIKYVNFSDVKLKWLYQNALCFVFPSLYEGFGMPILEAFSNNCPVVLSNRSCFPEIAGDSAVYFEPDDTDSILSSVKELIENESKRNEIVEKGKNRLKIFSWEKAAAETLEVYKRII